MEVEFRISVLFFVICGLIVNFFLGVTQGCARTFIDANQAVRDFVRANDGNFAGFDGFEVCGFDFSKHKKQAITDAVPLETQVVISAKDCSKLCLRQRFKTRNDAIFTGVVGEEVCDAFQYNMINRKCELFYANKDYEKLHVVRDQYSDFFQVHELDDQVCDTSNKRREQVASREVLKPPGKRNCSAERNNFVYRRIDNYTMDIGPAIAIPDVTELQCLEFCRTKEKLSTIQFMNCMGATYNKPRQVCYLFDVDSETIENNKIQVTDPFPIYNTEYTYFDRICLLDEASSLCSGVLETFPQKVLIGFNQQVDSVQSFEQCAESCLFYNSQVAGSCQSAMYYPEEWKSNCLLNFGDHVNEPIFFIDQTTERQVYYFALRSCSSHNNF